MIRKANSETDQISRSLLQKAVRRGNLHVTKLAIRSLVGNDDFDWLRKRLAVMAFEECWSYGADLTYEKDEEIVTHHYLKIAQTAKNKDAAGLGSLAYALSQGDASVLENNDEDTAIRIVAEAIKRPNDFWNWAQHQNLDEARAVFIDNAGRGFRKAGWPWDRAFAQAAAYLAVTTPIPQTEFCYEDENEDFPFWISLDKHTAQGRLALRQAAKLARLNANKVLWLGFYFESVTCNALLPSRWWDREVMWRMNKLQLSLTEARTMWKAIRPIVIDILKDETARLTHRIFSADTVPNRHIQRQPSMF